MKYGVPVTNGLLYIERKLSWLSIDLCDFDLGSTDPKTIMDLLRNQVNHLVQNKVAVVSGKYDIEWKGMLTFFTLVTFTLTLNLLVPKTMELIYSSRFIIV